VITGGIEMIIRNVSRGVQGWHAVYQGTDTSSGLKDKYMPVSLMERADRYSSTSC
jgi:hypothetical protein